MMSVLQYLDESTAIQAGLTEYLTFRLGSEEYALDIHRVQELRRYVAPTAIAHAPVGVMGVINLRGAIVPLVDLRTLLGMDHTEPSAFTVIIILNLGHQTVGIVVDDVNDVVPLSPEHIRPAPDFSSRAGTDYVTGIGTFGDRMLILADMERLLSGTAGVLSSYVH